jgi:hypothetical protein
LSNQEVIEQVAKGNRRLERPEECSEEIYEIMIQCWQTDPESRPKFSEIFEQLRSISQKLAPQDAITLENTPSNQKNDSIAWYSDDH